MRFPVNGRNDAAPHCAVPRLPSLSAEAERPLRWSARALHCACALHCFALLLRLRLRLRLRLLLRLRARWRTLADVTRVHCRLTRQ
jgi:hypothetical protein